jgi:outer membrane protein assembly factor BamB
VILASCGTRIVSTQKDGWTHSLDAATGVRNWSYPPAPAGIPFAPGDGTIHGDTRYMRGGAGWGDVYVTGNGGLNLVSTGVTGGYRRLHAFNVCASPATPANLLRWLVDIPGVAGAYSVGNISVTGGLFYVGTNTGHLMVIADPSVVPAVGLRCANPDVPNASCIAAGYVCVPQPAIIKDIALSGAMVYTEPALADGRVFVSTDGGHIYMLSP